MKVSKFFCVSLMAAGSAIARTDSTAATCEVRKDGDKQKGKSGPCESRTNTPNAIADRVEQETDMKRTRFATLAAAALLMALPAGAQQTTNVAFAKGASSATLKGSIKGDQDHSYFVDARAGQTMTVTLTSTQGSAEMNVFAPGNDTAISLGAVDPYNVTVVLPASGRYKVQVYQMRASARRGETANYTLAVSVHGGAAAAAPSHDALVSGTKYHATAEIACVTTVRIGEAEVYYVPDAFVFGG